MSPRQQIEKEIHKTKQNMIRLQDTASRHKRYLVNEIIQPSSLMTVTLVAFIIGLSFHRDRHLRSGMMKVFYLISTSLIALVRTKLWRALLR